MLTLEEAKSYLRVDADYEDSLIVSFLLSAEALCMDVARLSSEEWDAVSAYTAENETVPTFRGKFASEREILHAKSLLRAGALYALGYLYEHREKADLNGLALTLRGIVGSIREGAV